jgi:UPF0755 protein
MHRNKYIFYIVEVALVAIFAVLFVNRLFWQPPTGKLPQPLVIHIKNGTSITAAGKQLEKDNIISSAKMFVYYGRLFAGAETIKTGIYRFEQPHSAASAFEKLVSGKSMLLRLTLPEGISTRNVFAELVKTFDFDIDTLEHLATNRTFLNAIDPELTTIDGYILPETWMLEAGASARDILRTLVTKSLDIYRQNEARMRLLNRNRREIATIASIIEGECQFDDERALVASVYYNRLNRNMKLQADPTVQYLLKDGPRRLYLKDLDIDSPYNTYKYRGLPPGPINNPGKASIMAALKPAESDYLYFVADGTGRHLFASSYTDHLRNKKKLDALRREVYGR